MNNELREGLADLGPEAGGWVESLALHWELLCEWGARINLTAIGEPREAAWLHYRDSLEALPLLPGGRGVDIGSGGGFPGVPIAVARPDWQITLLEPRRKRVSFLRTVKAKLGLQNLTVVQGRSTDPVVEPFDFAVTRATFSAPEDLDHCLAWLKPGGKLIALRSSDDPELASEVHGYRVLDRDRRLEIWTAGG